MTITMYQGDTKTLAYTVTDRDGGAVNLSGATIRWQMARSVSKFAGTFTTPASVSKAVSTGIAVTDAQKGQFSVNLVPADTEALAEGEYYFEAEIIDSDGNVSTVSTGRLTLTRTLIKSPV